MRCGLDAADERGHEDPVVWEPELISDLPTGAKGPDSTLLHERWVAQPLCGGHPQSLEVGRTASLRWLPIIARSCPCGLRVALRRRFGAAAAAIVADDGFLEISRTEAPFVVFIEFFFRQRERKKEKWDSIDCVSFVQCSFSWMRLELLFIGKRKGSFYLFHGALICCCRIGFG